MKIPAVDRATAILLALSEHYSLTIKQVMQLYGWQSYPKATIAFKKLVEEKLIFRVRRHGLGKEEIEGDAYILLSSGARKLKESDFEPDFSFEPRQAALVSVVPLTHTLLVNSIIINLYLFQRAYPNRLRIEYLEHERTMRRKYGNTFKLYMDGFIKPLVHVGKKWQPMPFFIELQHTSQKDKQDYQTKIVNYLSLFETNLQTYFDTQAVFVLILTTNPEYVRHHVLWTEETLSDLHKEEYRMWFCIGSFDKNLPPVQFFCSPRFYNPFNDAPVVPFKGLALSSSSS